MQVSASIFLALVGLGSILQASACECTPLLSRAQEFKQVTAVYTATVVAMPSRRNTPTIIQLKVDKVFKGNRKALSRILEAENNCQFNFQIGKTYLIYADNEYSPTALFVNKCSRTKELIAAKKEELAELQKLAAKAGRQ